MTSRVNKLQSISQLFVVPNNYHIFMHEVCYLLGLFLAHLLSFIYLSSRFSCQHPQSLTQCWLAVNSCHSVFNLYSSYQLSSLQNSSKLSNHFSLCLYNITVCICCSFYCCCDNTYNYQVAHVLRTGRSRATIDTS